MTMSDFEKQLKQCVPETPTTDVGELFYQCGWNAKESADRPAVNVAARRQGPTFVVGMVCGLATATSLFLWNPTMTDDTVPVIVEEKSRSQTTKKNDALSGGESSNTLNRSITQESTKQSDAMPGSELIQPGWQVSDVLITDRIVQSDSPLSLVARRRWNQQLRASQTNRIAREANSDIRIDRELQIDREDLRAGPINQRLLEELLL